MRCGLPLLAPLTAAALTVATAGGAGAATRLGLANVAADGAAGQQSIAALRARLQDRADLTLPRDAARAALEEPLPPETGDDALRARATQLLAGARDAYSRFDYDGALERLGQAELVLAASAPGPAVTALLIDINLLVGVVEVDRGNHARAVDAFRVVQRLDPARKALDPGSYRPRAVALYAQAAAAASSSGQPPARLAVTSDPPGATVWIDGQSAGAAPLELALPPGFHYVGATARGSAPRLEKPLLRAGEVTRLPLLLARLPPEERVRQVRREIAADGTAWADGAQVLASSASLDLLVLVRGGATAQEAAIYDARAGTLGAWMPLAPPGALLAALAVKTTPPLADGRGPAAGLMTVGGTRAPPAAPSPAWYRGWWVVPTLLVLGAAAALGTVWLAERQPSATYTVDRWCFDKTCAP